MAACYFILQQFFAWLSFSWLLAAICKVVCLSSLVKISSEKITGKGKFLAVEQFTATQNSFPPQCVLIVCLIWETPEIFQSSIDLLILKKRLKKERWKQGLWIYQD